MISDAPMDPEFYGLVEDILANRTFQMLGDINHHGNSILDHSLKVSLLSWRVGRKLGLDTRSLARGALLHDFFLYDWKTGSSRRRRFYEFHKMHGFTHPLTALHNAEKYFSLNRREKDIIVKHMFPLTLIPPIFPESWLVCSIDTWVAVREIPKLIRHIFRHR